MSDEAPITIPDRKAGWRTAVYLGLAALMIAVVAAALAFKFHDRWSGASATTAQLPVVVVPAAGGAAPSPVIDLNALSTRETALAARLAELEARTAGVSNEARAASGYATRAEGMLVAFAARRAIDRGLALGYIEDQLRARFGPSQSAAVATILQATHDPVTIEDLRGGLDGIAPELVTGAASGGWGASLRRELSNLIVLHKAGTPSPLPVDRLARARRMLEAGQVEPALAEVARMPGAPQADRWMAAARRYIGVRQALDTIETAAIQGQPGIAAPPVASAATPAP